MPDISSQLLADLMDQQVKPRAGSADPGVPQTFLPVRKLNAGDMAMLANPLPTGLPQGSIATIRSRHHSVAQMIASGVSVQEAAYATGYAPGTVSCFKADPAFQELVEFYRTQVQHRLYDIHQRLVTIGNTALEELQDRLEEGKLSSREIIDVAVMAMDRSIAPPKSGFNVNASGAAAQGGLAINVYFGKEGQQVSQGPSPSIIDVTPEKVS